MNTKIEEQEHLDVVIGRIHVSVYENLTFVLDQLDQGNKKDLKIIKNKQQRPVQRRQFGRGSSGAQSNDQSKNYIQAHPRRQFGRGSSADNSQELQAKL